MRPLLAGQRPSAEGLKSTLSRHWRFAGRPTDPPCDRPFAALVAKISLRERDSAMECRSLLAFLFALVAVERQSPRWRRSSGTSTTGAFLSCQAGEDREKERA